VDSEIERSRVPTADKGGERSLEGSQGHRNRQGLTDRVSEIAQHDSVPRCRSGNHRTSEKPDRFSPQASKLLDVVGVTKDLVASAVVDTGAKRLLKESDVGSSRETRRRELLDISSFSSAEGELAGGHSKHSKLGFRGSEITRSRKGFELMRKETKRP
jgi:hypothetical protein